MSPDTPKLPILTATVPEFANSMNISEASVYRHIASGKFRAIRLGGRLLISLKEIGRILDGK